MTSIETVESICLVCETYGKVNVTSAEMWNTWEWMKKCEHLKSADSKVYIVFVWFEEGHYSIPVLTWVWDICEVGLTV